MAEYTDFTFDISDYGVVEEYTDNSAMILAIKNILLSRKGNYPFNPSFGMDIAKYQFDLLDEVQLKEIKSELSNHINKYIPRVDDLIIDIRIIEDERLGQSGGILGISISSKLESDNMSATFLVYKDREVVNVINEIR